MEATPTQSKLAKALTGVAAAISSLAAGMWAIITYVFPDPSVLGLGVVNWKNFLSFCAAFLFLVVVMIARKADRFPKLIRGSVNFLLAAGLSSAFFILGMEYAKPSFAFAQNQQKAVENDSPTLFGGRIEMVDNVKVQLTECRVVAQTPTCAFELTSTNRDREIGFSPETSFFEPTGGSLRIDRIVIGNTPSNRTYGIPLVRNLATQITVIFQPTREKIDKIPSVKLVMNGLEHSNQIVKFNDVASL